MLAFPGQTTFAPVKHIIMKEYMLIFRLDIVSREAQPTELQMTQYMQQWTQWVDNITAKGQLSGGNHLQYSGKVIRPGGVVTDIPYVANLESVAGYILITAKSMDAAIDIAKRCPILNGGDKNSVEVRETAAV